MRKDTGMLKYVWLYLIDIGYLIVLIRLLKTGGLIFENNINGRGYRYRKRDGSPGHS
jgi:hypothetical protein